MAYATITLDITKKLTKREERVVNELLALALRGVNESLVARWDYLMGTKMVKDLLKREVIGFNYGWGMD